MGLFKAGNSWVTKIAWVPNQGSLILTTGSSSGEVKVWVVGIAPFEKALTPEGLASARVLVKPALVTSTPTNVPAVALAWHQPSDKVLSLSSTSILGMLIFVCFLLAVAAGLGDLP